MFRILYSDTRKILTHSGFKICLIINITYPLITLLLLKLLQLFINRGDINADSVAFLYASFASLLVTASTLLTTACEFSDGCIRNKLISGAGRHEVVISAIIGGMFQGLIHTMTAFVTSVFMCLVFTTGFDGYSISEVADYWLVITFAAMAIGAFSTMIVMVMRGGKLSYVISLVISVGMNIGSMEVLDKLFPSAGKFDLVGSKLLIYTSIDRFVPYMYLAVRPHYGFGSYIAGTLGLIIISMAIGIIIFNKKEIS